MMDPDSDSDDDFLPFSVPVLAMMAAEMDAEEAGATEGGPAVDVEVDGLDPMEWFGLGFRGRRQGGPGTARPNRAAPRLYIEENLEEGILAAFRGDHCSSQWCQRFLGKPPRRGSLACAEFQFKFRVP